MEVSSLNRTNTDMNVSTEVKSEFTKEKRDNKKEEQLIKSNDELDKKIDEVNKFLKEEKIHAEYSVHKTFSYRILIKIVDDKTKKIIMEVPPEKLLDAVASMCKAAGILVDKKA
ncbi:flagellar protein FlaG [Clostridium sp. MSJ-8]|uniref:flagellar protein FlaG n=1 Tax=Clostridium sp. MSJ-8 TaxID=2841510 RepID=UPI001C0F3346|nr:flagellar protein FlaG [Clostridium sp. MSJ-8]MBU5488439.1 flagellar protein FlaG [Clostridium sp. MSJ-8]